MKIDTLLFKRQIAEFQQPVHLCLQISDHIFILHAQNFTWQFCIPMIHHFDVGLVIVTDFLEAVGEFLAFMEQLLNSTPF